MILTLENPRAEIFNAVFFQNIYIYSFIWAILFAATQGLFF